MQPRWSREVFYLLHVKSGYNIFIKKRVEGETRNLQTQLIYKLQYMCK